MVGEAAPSASGPPSRLFSIEPERKISMPPEVLNPVEELVASEKRTWSQYSAVLLRQAAGEAVPKDAADLAELAHRLHMSATGVREHAAAVAEVRELLPLASEAFARRATATKAAAAVRIAVGSHGAQMEQRYKLRAKLELWKGGPASDPRDPNAPKSIGTDGVSDPSAKNIALHSHDQETDRLQSDAERQLQPLQAAADAAERAAVEAEDARSRVISLRSQFAKLF
jgi:hypothetical protein